MLASPAPSTSPDPRESERARWRRAVRAHAALFALFLLGLRVERLLALTDGTPDLRSWVAFLLPELGAAAVVAGLALASPTFRGRRLVLLAAHGVLGTVLVLSQSFLLKTGFRPPWEMVVYAARNVRMLGTLLAVEVDPRLGWRLGALVASLALAPVLARHLPAGRRRAVTPWALAGAGLVVLALPAWPGVPRGYLASNDLWVLARSAVPTAWSRAGTAAGAASAEEPYQRPRLTGRAEGPRPNLLLLVLESTGADVVAPYSPAAATPALAAMAQRGVVVDGAYAAVSHTSKALVGMLCSMMPRLEMDPWESLEGNLPLTCLPHLLAELGYQTAYLQSAQGAFENRPGLIRNLGFSFSAYRETLERPGFERLGYFGLDDRAMAAPALSWIDGHRETPWLMVLLTSSTHHPYQTPGVSLARAQADPRSAYARAVALQDELLGGLLAGLADRGELERTVVLVIGDHGEAFGQHGLNHHDMVPYEEVTRVPWLLDGPEELIGPPRRIGGLRHHFDLLPTVLGVLGVDWSGRVLGTDLLHGPGHDRVVSSCWFENGCLGMRRGDLKLVHHFGSRPLEVFDLAADPGERVDLARTLDASLLRELESSLFGFQLSVDRFWGRQPLGRGRKLWWAEGTRLGERPLQP